MIWHYLVRHSWDQSWSFPTASPSSFDLGFGCGDVDPRPDALSSSFQGAATSMHRRLNAVSHVPGSTPRILVRGAGDFALDVA